VECEVVEYDVLQRKLLVDALLADMIGVIASRLVGVGQQVLGDVVYVDRVVRRSCKGSNDSIIDCCNKAD